MAEAEMAPKRDAMASACECEWNYTCGPCLSNPKPWHYTLNDGTAVHVTMPPMGALSGLG